jgi:hypothetical protein
MKTKQDLSRTDSPQIAADTLANGVAHDLDAELRHHVNANGILVPQPPEVAHYLLENPGLDSALPAIFAEARKAFGPETELSLELYRDREVDDRYLTLYVRQEAYQPGFFDKIERVSAIFNDSLTDLPGYFLLTSDFHRPKTKNGI